MSFFKRFSDVLVGFCALCGIIGVLRKYMSYEFSEDELLLGTVEKIKLFLSPEAKDEPRHFVLFVALMLISLLVGRIFARVPWASLAISALPFFSAVILFFDKRLGDTPIFFVLCTAVGFIGALFDSLSLDSQRGFTLTHHVAALFGLLFGTFALVFPRLTEKTAELITVMPSDAEGPLKRVADRAELFGINLFFETLPEELRLMELLLTLILISLALSYLLRGAYFIDLLFSGAILILVLAKWHAGVLVRSESPVIALALIYFILRLAIFFAEPEPRSILKFLKIKKEKVTAED